MKLDYFLSALPQARNYGKYVAGLCPYHEDKKPSLLVYEDGWFGCLACGKKGSHEQLQRKLQGWDDHYTFRTETSWRGPRDLPSNYLELNEFCQAAHFTLLDFPQLQWYLQVRGVEERIEPNMIGWHEGWYVIPAYSDEGVFLGAVLLADSKIEAGTGLRYIIPPGQSAKMFVPDWRLWKKAEAVAIVFGIFDALALAALRIPVATTTGNKFTFRPEWLDDVRKKIVVIPDRGEEKEGMALVSRLGWRGEVFCLPYDDDTKDPADYLKFGRRDKIEKILQGALV